MKVLVTVCDLKAKLFNPPCAFHNREDAIRSFCDLFRSGQDSMMVRHPEDFSLFYVGDFDEQSGRVSPVEPYSLVSGLDVRLSDKVFDEVSKNAKME